MIFTFLSIAFRESPIEEIIPRVAAIGYDAVEIWAKHLEGKSDAELTALRELAEASNLRIEVVSPYLWLTQTPELLHTSMAIARETVHQARLLNCPKIRTFTDSGPTGIGSAVATPDQWDTAVAALKTITALDRTLAFVVETHPLTLADSVEGALKLLERVNAPNLKILYQPEAGTMVSGYEALKPHIRHVHLQNADDQGNPTWLEEGSMDLSGFVSRLARDGYAESVSVEYWWEGCTWERAETAYRYLVSGLNR